MNRLKETAQSLEHRFGGWVYLMLWAPALLLQLVGFHGLRHDDAFITYRYGQNLAEGLGLVFNVGERVMGSTAPGHALLSALLYAIVGQDALPTVMAGLGIVAWSGQGLIIMYLLRPSIGFWGALVAGVAVWAGSANSQDWVALETNLVVALTLGAIAISLAGRWMWAAFVVALASLFRPDAFLVAAILGVACVRATGRESWKPALLFSFVVAPWFIFAYGYFGSVLPQSATVKVLGTSPGVYLLHIVEHSGWLATTSALPWMVALSWALAALGAWSIVKGKPHLGMLVVYALGHFAAYALLGPDVSQTWHIFPGSLLFTVFMVCGLVFIVRTGRPPVLRVTAVMALGALLFVYGARSYDLAEHQQESYWNGSRHQVYAEVSEYLNEHAAATDRVSSAEVGTIAYLTRLPMHDVIGLLSSNSGQPPEDVRWHLAVSHGLRGWGEPDWSPPTRITRDGQPPVAVFRSHDFYAWLFWSGGF